MEKNLLLLLTKFKYSLGLQSLQNGSQSFIVLRRIRHSKRYIDNYSWRALNGQFHGFAHV